VSALETPITLTEEQGLDRAACVFRVGIPLPYGACADAACASLIDASRVPIAAQFKVLARWPDRSVKWLLLDAITSLRAGERRELKVLCTDTPAAQSRPTVELAVAQSGNDIEINTGTARFRIGARCAGPVLSAAVGGAELLSSAGSDLQLTGSAGERYDVHIERRFIDEQGPLRVSVVTEGKFTTGLRTLRFVTRAVFHAGTAAVRFEVKLLNPHVAHHRGGQWDLGDPGSYYFKDLSLRVFPAGQAMGLDWYSQSFDQARNSGAHDGWVLYQDSSGGEHWDSDNHVDLNGQPTVAFRGYEVRVGGKVVEQGDRATPCLSVATSAGGIAASVEDFWQNFPKALRWQDGALAIALFPAESRGAFELQGGEQKRHAVLLDFVPPGQPSLLPQLQSPPLVRVDAHSLEASGAIPYFVSELDDSSAAYATYISGILDGTQSFFAKREIIDEYGWRNFGDLYADHEAVKHKGPRPLVSHYNNQYDFILGAFFHFQRTGDGRWRRLMQDAARHVMDIDVYHTNEDKTAFNGGLFWHTDHYKPALTSSHRTYSGKNSGGGDYGGGPSNEHNYTSGLLHYHYQTGDEEAKATVLGLANWVIAMDDGAGTLLTLLDDGPTGLASNTVSPDFHKAGRGAGNSINALLDGYALSRDRRYVTKAEELIQRCIHPDDDIHSLGLLEPEYRWSYLVFLQVLGKYLDQKREWGELDHHYYYARESLLHYARWIARHEVPYKDVLHKVEIPTETWPAHDVRKSHVLYIAAKYAPADETEGLRERAKFFFERCIADVTSFETAYLTRPLVILAVYGGVHAYYQRYGSKAIPYAVHDYHFGTPTEFVPQRRRIKSVIARKRTVAAGELRRILRDKLRALTGKAGGK
jgi:hypothetical protein